MEDSMLFNMIKYYKSIYCVLYEDGTITYYRNQNDYYMNEKFGIKGFINLTQEYRINEINPSDDIDTDNIFEIEVNKPQHQIWRLKCKDKLTRGKWIDYHFSE